MSDDSSKPTKDPYVASWSPSAAIVWTIVIYLLTFVFAGLIASLVPMLLGWSDARTEAWWETVSAQFIYVLILEGATVLAVGLFLRYKKTDFRALGFRKPRWGDLGWMAGVFFIYFGAFILVTTIIGVLLPLDLDKKQELVFDPQASYGAVALAMAFVSLVILPPLVEEMVFRGFLFGGLRRTLPFTAAAIITSILFALPHMGQSASGGVLWIAGIDTFILSLFLCYLREKTGSLWASIGLHAIKNSIAFVSLFILQAT